MNERFHIIVTGEDGRSSAFQLSKIKFAFSVASAVICLVCVGVFGYLTTGSYLSNKLLSRNVKELQIKLSRSEAAGCEYLEEIGALKQTHAETLSSLKKTYDETLASLKGEYTGEIAALEEEHNRRLNDLQTKFDLENTTLQLENVKLMSTAVSELHERSELIESVMDNIGVELKKSKKKSPSANSGGPFIPATDQSYVELLKKTEEYLEAINRIPLGRPVSGSISSKFGTRSDPLNKKKAIHEGVDIRGKKGEKIRVTASGKVIRAFKNGSYGNYVEIDHKNGYRTIYAHMQNYLVTKGETVKQGQIIGQVGSSGRSTGPHLHYEILLNKKPVDPVKFMKVADLSHTLTSSQE